MAGGQTKDLKFPKFIHERIMEARPSDVMVFSMKAHVDTFCKALQQKKLVDYKDHYRFLKEHEKEFARAFGITGSIPKDFTIDLSEDSFTTMAEDLCSRSFYFSMAMSIVPDFSPVYVISKDFFARLKNLDVSPLTFDVLPEKFRCIIKFPEPLYDTEGHSFGEVGILISDSETLSRTARLSKTEVVSIVGEGKTLYPNDYEDRYICFFWSANGNEKMEINGKYIDTELPSHWLTYIPKDKSIKIKDIIESGKNIRYKDGREDLGSDSYDYNKNVILAAVVYILSGNPDLREFKNPVRYQSPTSKTPVKADKWLSNVPIHLVNFGWKKPPLYHKGSWLVHEFERLQPYGPIDQLPRPVKIVTIREHERSRKKGAIVGESGNRDSMKESDDDQTPTET